MIPTPRAFLSIPACVAALALSAAVAEASSLGTRYPALRQEIQDRVDAIPEEGASSAEAKERKKLVAALFHLDIDSPTLDSDLALAIKALTQFRKASPAIYNGANVLNLNIDIRDEVGVLWDEVPYYPRWLSGSKMFRYEQVIQFFLGTGTLEPDPLKALKWYAKALKQVRKRDAYAAKELVPGKKDTLKIRFWSPADDEQGTKYVGEKTSVQVGAVYDTGDDTLTLQVTLVKGGVTRIATIVVDDPGIGDRFNPTAVGTLTVDGSSCEFDQVTYAFTFSAFDPETGLVAGSCTFFYDDTEALVNCGQVQGIFTVRAMTVQP